MAPMKTGAAGLTSEDVCGSKVPTLFLSLVFYHKAEKKKRICVTSIARATVERTKEMFSIRVKMQPSVLACAQVGL